MRVPKALRRWRPKRPPNVPRAQKLTSRLFELEREIKAMLSPIRDYRLNGVKKEGAIRQGGNQTQVMAASGPDLNPIAAHPVSRSYEPKVATQIKRISKRQTVGGAGALGLFLSICFGLLAICGVIIALLFLQLKDMKVDITGLKQRLAATEAHLGKVEKIAQQQIAKEPNIFDTPPRKPPISLGDDEIKAIRAFIKILPSKPGAMQQKTLIGDKVSNTKSAPIPESLVSQMPKLRGAKFFVDQNGAIIIIGEGSNRADAVIEPQ
jgi:hypothetical protein